MSSAYNLKEKNLSCKFLLNSVFFGDSISWTFVAGYNRKRTGPSLCVHTQSINLNFHYFRGIFSLKTIKKKNGDKTNENYG